MKTKATRRERIVWLGMGSALTTVTFSMIAVGIVAVQWLAGGSSPAKIEAPVAAPPIAGESPRASALPAVDAERSPLVLTPQEGSPRQTLLPGGNEAGYSIPDWDSPPPGVKTADPGLGPRYR